ncbi:hypothetical protein J6P68_03365 [bacterium]|nr:hypothetical protein [bacterium]
MIINENKINDQIKIKNILIKYKTTAYKLTTEEIQYFYHKQNLQYLSKQQQKNAVFANEVKNKVNNCFFEQIKKHLTNCAKTLCKDNEMNDNKALSKAIAKRKTTFGVIKNKIL